jgi:hypothetical protein
MHIRSSPAAAALLLLTLAGCHAYRAAYTDYGSTTRPEPPAAGDQTPAPDATYELFSGVQYAGPDVG